MEIYPLKISPDLLEDSIYFHLIPDVIGLTHVPNTYNFEQITFRTG